MNEPEGPRMSDDSRNEAAQRRRKLADLRRRGEAYPNTFRRKDLAVDLANAYGEMSKEALAEAPVEATVAGRVMLRRVMGKASFVTLEDPSGRIQSTCAGTMSARTPMPTSGTSGISVTSPAFAAP